MKKLITFISLCLAVVMALPLVASCTAGEMPFTDVKDGKWYYDNVKYVYENGIMNGVTGTKFDPNGTLTRGMCATIIYRMAGSPETYAENKFDDVKAEKYYTKAVTWAQSKGIVNGKTETAFDPDGDIKRAEFATMLYRYLSFKMLVLPAIKDASPADDELIPSYATKAVDALFRAGVVNGREDGRFDPKAKITRAEAAAMIDRFVRKAEKKSITGDDDVLGIAFLGNSMFFVPKTPDHFKAIAGDKHKVEIFDQSRGGWILRDHFEKWNRRDRLTVKTLTKDWDVVLFNEGVATPTLQLKEEFLLSYEVSKQYLYYSSFDKYYEATVSRLGQYPSWKCYEMLVNIFGEDKLYFNLTKSNIMKKEGGTAVKVESFSQDGLKRYVIREYLGPDDPFYIKYEHSNKAEFMWRDWLKANCNVNRIMLNLDSFDPDNPLNLHDFDLWPEDNVHPNLMYGYCHALALYCTIFDEPCIEQNNGILTDEDIPGDTPEEKAAYMVMIKNLVQEELDFQNAH